jgi:hypothetical protein
MLRSLPRRAAAVLALVALSAFLAAAGRSGLAGSSALSLLNAERARLGIPGSIVENAEWSRRCALHNHYLALNGDFGHYENPANPGYTSEGQWAGEHSVLALARQFTMVSFLSAPLHLLQLLSPRLEETGVAESDGFVCITTWPGYRSSESTAGPVHVFTFPRRGANDVPAAQRAGEEPFVPGTFVGIPAGARTGPYLLVYSDGGWSGWSTHLAQATLRGSGGLVETRTVDRSTAGIGDYVPPGAGLVIPVRPLAAGRRYTVKVTFRDGSRVLRYTWAFKTRG